MHGEALLQVAPASSGAQVSAYSGRRQRTAVQPDTGGRGLPAEDIQGMGAGRQGDSCWGVGEGGKWIGLISGGIKYCIWPDHVHRLVCPMFLFFCVCFCNRLCFQKGCCCSGMYNMRSVECNIATVTYIQTVHMCWGINVKPCVTSKE